MNEYPILFSVPMVRAIVDGRKTQTRRVVKHQPKWPLGYMTVEGGAIQCGADYPDGDDDFVKCPYGVVGNRLIPLCTWSVAKEFDSIKPSELPIKPIEKPIKLGEVPIKDVWTPWVSEKKPDWCGRLRPGRFMPLFLRGCLPRLENCGVRAEQLQSISEPDAIAEGVDAIPMSVMPRNGTLTRRDDFAQIWSIINGKSSWDANEWVWVIEFRGMPL